MSRNKISKSPKSDKQPEAPPPPHMIGYARVSMSDQNNQRQIDEFLRFGVAAEDIYADNASGRTMQRPGWQAALKDLREGDLLVINAVDRLGRDLIEVVQTVRDLEKRGINLKVMSMDIDTRTPTGRMIFAIIAAMAQWERELIVERTQHGLAAARARGRIGGQQKVVSDVQVRAAMRRYAKGEDIADIAGEYGISRQALYRRIAKIKAERRERNG